jgi:hypothetical protein
MALPYSNDSKEIFVADVAKEQCVYLEEPVPYLPGRSSSRGRQPTRLVCDAMRVRVDQWVAAQPEEACQRISFRLWGQVRLLNFFVTNVKKSTPLGPMYQNLIFQDLTLNHPSLMRQDYNVRGCSPGFRILSSITSATRPLDGSRVCTTGTRISSAIHPA